MKMRKIGWKATSMALSLAMALGNFTSVQAALADAEKESANSIIAEEAVNQNNLSLKEIYKDDFLIGNIYNPWDSAESKKELLMQHFNVVTPENLMKPNCMQNEKGKFTFDAADDMLDFCKNNNFQVVGHTFAWNQQTSAWMTETETKEEAIENLKTHIYTVASRYEGRILSWDVVNEAIRDGAVLPENGDWTKCLKEDGWNKIIGPDYIKLAFQFAHEADPYAKLYYNDYGLDTPQKAEITAAMFRDLKEQSVPIDGIGMQSHYDTHTSPDNVENAISLFENAGAQIAVSEIDIGVSEAEGADGLTKEQEKQQAEAYARLFQVYLKHAYSIERVTFWGVDDANSWRKDVFPCLFNDDYSAKEAFYAVADPYGYLGEEKPPSFEESIFTFDNVQSGFKNGGAIASGNYTLTDHGDGKALSLDGSEQFLEVTAEDGKSLLRGMKELTVSMQVKPEKSITNWLFYAAPDVSVPIWQEEVYLGILDSNFYVRAERYRNTGSRPDSAAVTILEDKWTYITVVYKEKETNIYVNGEEKARQTSEYGLKDILGYNSICYIGKATWGTGEYYKGLIDNYKIVNRALTPDEIAEEAVKYVEAEPEPPVLDRPFVDVDKETGSWYYDAVYYNYDKKIMNGVNPTHFEPLSNLARAQFAIILYNVEGKPAASYEPKFKDVADGQWYTNAILWASSKEIVTGYTDGSERFGWGDNILREQMAVMMYRYAKNLKQYDVSDSADFDNFADAALVDDYAKKAMKWAVGTGIITGKDNGMRLDPLGNASRAECAIIIQRFMDKYKEKIQ